MSVEDRVIAWLARQDADAYLVGGWVRDRILGRTSYDIDIAVSGDGMQLARRLANSLDADYYALDRERGTGRAILQSVGGDRLLVDIACFRGADLAADLAGRDFTINALAVDVHAPEVVIDRHGGLADLKAGIIRTVSEDAIRSDPLRALRAVRQAAQLDFALAPEMEALIRRDGAGLADVSAERICEELSKLLSCAYSAPYLFELDRLGLLGAILPEIESLRGFEQPPPHRYGVLRHSLEAVGALESLLGELGLAKQSANAASRQEPLRRLEIGGLAEYAERIDGHLEATMSDARPRVVVLKLAALLHDVGKPGAVTVEEEGRLRFFGHETDGSQIAYQALQRLRFSAAETRMAEIIVRNHMRPLTLASQERVSARAVYRFFRDTGDAGVDILLLALADHLATYGSVDEDSGWSRLLELVTRMQSYYWDREAEPAKTPPLLNGRDLLDGFGLQPGKQIGRLLEVVREAQAVGEVSTRDEAMALVRGLIGD